MSLTVTQLPWLGADFVARVHGVPSTAFAVNVIGFSPTSTPLSSVLTAALPGCTLSVFMAWVDTLAPANGTALARVAVPNNASLVGQSFVDQAVVLEIAAGAIQAATSSNALQMTIGVL